MESLVAPAVQCAEALCERASRTVEQISQDVIPIAGARVEIRCQISLSPHSYLLDVSPSAVLHCHGVKVLTIAPSQPVSGGS